MVFNWLQNGPLVALQCSHQQPPVVVVGSFFLMVPYVAGSASHIHHANYVLVASCADRSKPVVTRRYKPEPSLNSHDSKVLAINIGGYGVSDVITVL